MSEMCQVFKAAIAFNLLLAKLDIAHQEVDMILLP